MKRLQKNQAGIGAVTTILVVVIVALIGVAGWLVYKNHHKTAQSTPPAPTHSFQADLSVHKLPGNKLPADMLQGITAIWNEKIPNWQTAPASEGCIGPGNQNYTVYEVNDAYAEAGLYCNSPAATLFVKVNGTWQAVESTQFEFSCATISKYNIPKALIVASSPGGTCLNASNQSQAVQ